MKVSFFFSINMFFAFCILVASVSAAYTCSFTQACPAGYRCSYLESSSGICVPNWCPDFLCIEPCQHIECPGGCTIIENDLTDLCNFCNWEVCNRQAGESCGDNLPCDTGLYCLDEICVDGVCPTYACEDPCQKCDISISKECVTFTPVSEYGCDLCPEATCEDASECAEMYCNDPCLKCASRGKECNLIEVTLPNGCLDCPTADCFTPP